MRKSFSSFLARSILLAGIVSAQNVFAGAADYVYTPAVEYGEREVDLKLGTTSPQTIGGTGYNFGSWSDRGAQTHEITTPERPTTYTATFTPVAGPTIQFSAATFAVMTALSVDMSACSRNHRETKCVHNATFASVIRLG